MIRLSEKPAQPSLLRVKSGIAGLAAGMIVWTGGAQAALPAQGYADLVEKVSPSVVFISSSQKKSGSKAADDRRR